MEQTARCRPARADDAEAVLALVRRTVEEVYPRYYPQGVADFFLLHHSGESIMRDIAAGNVRGGFPCRSLSTAGMPLRTQWTA